MLTPKFVITQDDAHIFIKIHISNVRFSTSNLDISINSNMVNFSLLPYYLRLTFNEDEHLMGEEDIVTQNMIQEVGNPGSQLEQPFECKLLSEEDVIEVKLFKKTKNQVFSDLDNHLRLLNRQEATNNTSMLNVVDNPETKQKKLIQEIDDDTNDIPMLSKLGETFDWQIKQNVNVENEVKNNKIGFSNKYNSDAIIPSIYNNNEINEVAEAVLLKESEDFESELIQLRNYRDNLKFDPDYYMNDYITFKYGQVNEQMKEDLDINGILEILKYIPTEIKYFLKWVKMKGSDKPKFKDLISYNEFEQEQMREKIPKNIQHEDFGNILADSDIKLIPKQTPLFLQLTKSPKNLKFDDLNDSWKQNFTFLINAVFGYFFQSMEFDYSLNEDQKEKVPSSTYKPSKREQTSERSWLIGKLTPQLSNLDKTLLLKDFGIKESCNWKPEFKAENKDVDMEDDFIIKEVVEDNVEEPDIKISDLEDKHNIIKAALIISIKKSLSYPLHRNLQLSLKVVDYVNYTFLGGSKLIIKILLKIHELFRYDDTFYIYNKIWLDDMITWLLRFCDTEFHDMNNETVRGDDILDELFKDIASKISFTNRSFQKEDFDFMIIQSELNEQGDNIEWDSINIQEIENIADVKYNEFFQSI